MIVVRQVAFDVEACAFERASEVSDPFFGAVEASGWAWGGVAVRAARVPGDDVVVGADGWDDGLTEFEDEADAGGAWATYPQVRNSEFTANSPCRCTWINEDCALPLLCRTGHDDGELCCTNGVVCPIERNFVITAGRVPSVAEVSVHRVEVATWEPIDPNIIL